MSFSRNFFGKLCTLAAFPVMSFILKCILLNETLETWGKAARVALRSLPLYCGKRVFCAHSHSSVCCIASIHYISASIGTWSHIALFEVDLPMRQSQKFSRKNMSRVELEWTPVRNKLLENMWEKMNKEHLWYTVNDRFLKLNFLTCLVIANEFYRNLQNWFDTQNMPGDSNTLKVLKRPIHFWPRRYFRCARQTLKHGRGSKKRWILAAFTNVIFTALQFC